MAYINKIVVNGQEVNANQLEGILDSEGHNRFIEGSVTRNAITGVTFNYYKWSLSGTHLMIVLSGTIDNASFYNDQYLGITEGFPSWLSSKINPDANGIVGYKKIAVIAADTSVGSEFPIVLKKTDSGQCELRVRGGTASLTGSFRIQFDLLIDSASD